MDREQFDRLIQFLECARTRPAMYFGAVEVDAAMHFLNGVGLAVMAFAGDNITIRRQVVAERGWGTGVMHPSQPMLDRGLSPAQVIDELLVIEIETVRRLVEE